VLPTIKSTKKLWKGGDLSVLFLFGRDWESVTIHHYRWSNYTNISMKTACPGKSCVMILIIFNGLLILSKLDIACLDLHDLNWVKSMCLQIMYVISPISHL
jgi:hypothetical protein